MSINLTRATLSIAVAAFAATLAIPASAHAPQTVYADGGTMKYDMNSGKYCLTDQITGTRIGQTTCKTKDGWAADGLTISSK